MYDVVIPVRTPLQPTANEELKFALRSIELHLKNAGKVVIIGHCPEWLNLENIEYIPYKENDWFKKLTRNIHEKIKLACESSKVSDIFLYYNDDHFLLESVSAVDYPYYHGGAEFGGRGQYRKATVPDTVAMLKTENQLRPIYNYDIHTPMIMHSGVYTKQVGALNWKKDFGYCIKTCYAYMSGMHQYGQAFADLKIYEAPKTLKEVEQLVEGRHIFSTGDKAFKCAYDETGRIPNSIVQFLESNFPKKSIYEL